MVTTHTYVLARMMNRAALTNNDVACNADLSAPNLNAQSL